MARQSPPRPSSTTAPRWVVGIDLGTTNCVLAAADTTAEPAAIDVVPIPQVVAPSRSRRASCCRRSCISPAPTRSARSTSRGRADATSPSASSRDARRRRAGAPGRVGEVVALPRRRRSQRGDPAVGRRGGRTPRLAGRGDAAYLAHLRDAWNAAHAGDKSARLEAQDVSSPCPRRSTRPRASSPWRRRATPGLDERHAARGAAGRLLRLDRRQRRRVAQGAPAPATSCSSATSAAAPPTSA